MKFPVKLSWSSNMNQSIVPSSGDYFFLYSQKLKLMIFMLLTHTHENIIYFNLRDLFSSILEFKNYNCIFSLKSPTKYRMLRKFWSGGDFLIFFCAYLLSKKIIITLPWEKILVPFWISKSHIKTCTNCLNYLCL